MDSLFSQIQAIVWLGVCAFALFKGDRPERIAGGALVIAWLATLTVHRINASNDYADIAWAVMAVEGVVLLVLVGLAWKSEHAWPVWACGFQAITVMVQIITLIDFRIGIIAYLSAQAVGTYGVLACLAIGTFWAWQIREAIRPREDDSF